MERRSGLYRSEGVGVTISQAVFVLKYVASMVALYDAMLQHSSPRVAFAAVEDQVLADMRRAWV